MPLTQVVWIRPGHEATQKSSLLTRGFSLWTHRQFIQDYINGDKQLAFARK